MFPQRNGTVSPTTLWQAKSLLAKEIFTAVNAPWPGAFFVFLEKEEMHVFDKIYIQRGGKEIWKNTHGWFPAAEAFGITR